MHIGAAIFPTAETMNPVEFATTAEALGFESIWFPEHSHIPTSRRSPWGGYEGAPPLPDYYARTYDPFVALGACAASTSTIKLATGICLVAQRDPIHTAKEVASVDGLSDGRMIFGIGYGWNREEMAQHGTRYGDRREVLRDRIMAMKALWSEDEASYDGEYVTIEPSWAWPKPVRQPHPPIVLGGAAGPKTAKDVAEFCDGWMPIGGRGFTNGWDGVRRACDDIGRDVATIELGVFDAPPDEAKLAGLAKAGLTRAVVSMPQGPRDEVLAELERVAPLIDALSDA
jgi:probable F420-dependent oxidoreductase